MLETNGTCDASDKEQRNERSQQFQFPAVGPDERLVGIVSCRVPVEKFAEFDTHVGHQTRDVGRPDSGSGEFGDDGVSQTHDEAKQHHGCRHEQPFVPSEIAAKQAETGQQ